MFCVGECNHTDIRLANGGNPMEGRVEICVNGTWGTISRFGWTPKDAIVICKQLGYSTESKPHLTKYIIIIKLHYSCICSE